VGVYARCKTVPFSNQDHPKEARPKKIGTAKITKLKRQPFSVNTIVSFITLGWLPLRLPLRTISITLYCVIVDIWRRQVMLQRASRKLSLRQRSLLSLQEAGEIRDLFTILANETRLRLLHALVQVGELCVTDLAKRLGMKPQAISNQLQRLADRKILATRREGNHVFYRIVDPCVPTLLFRGICLVEDTRDS
jgi:ArsR family transcriptional regulator, lead/cadmium/zinc/bismuth-responsive transcriptional repressor